MLRRRRVYRQAALSMPIVLLLAANAMAQEDKKTDDDKPADPDTGESTVEEKTLGLLPNPLQRYGVKFVATYIVQVLGNALISAPDPLPCPMSRPSLLTGSRSTGPSLPRSDRASDHWRSFARSSGSRTVLAYLC